MVSVNTIYLIEKYRNNQMQVENIINIVQVTFEINIILQWFFFMEENENKISYTLKNHLKCLILISYGIGSISINVILEIY